MTHRIGGLLFKSKVQKFGQNVVRSNKNWDRLIGKENVAFPFLSIVVATFIDYHFDRAFLQNV